MPAGVPTFEKFGEQKKAKYLRLLRKGVHRAVAARNVGVSGELVRLYRHATPGWAAEEEAAELEANGEVENALFRSAADGNVTACQVWLYNRCPDRWKDMRTVNANVNVRDLDEAIAGELARVAGAGETQTAGTPAGAADAPGVTP